MSRPETHDNPAAESEKSEPRALPEQSSAPERTFRREDFPFSRSATIGLALVLALAAALRFYRLDFDLPEVQYVDGFKFVGQAKRMAESGDMRPTDFQYPGLYVYTLAVLFRVLGVTSSYGQQLAAAAVAAFFGVAVVGATALAAWNIAGTRGLLVASALAATSPTLVTQSRTPAPDTACAFFMTVAIALVANRPVGLSKWIAGGAAVGLAASAKWTGLLAAPLVAVAAIATAWREKSPLALLRIASASAAAFLVAFLVTTPFFLPLRDQYVSILRFTMDVERAGQIGRVQDGPLDYFVSRTPTWGMPWLGTSLPSDLGWPAFLLSAAGVVGAVAGRFGFAGRLYAAGVAAYLFTSSGSGWIKAIRFLLPILPLLWAVSGAFVERAVPTGLRRRRLVWVAILAAVCAAPAYRSLTYVVAHRQPSTNALVRDWMRTNVPAGSVVLLGPFFTDDLYQLPFRFKWLKDVGRRQYNLPPDKGLSPERTPIYAPSLIDAFRRAGVQYVVLNSYFDGALSRIPENERFFPRSVASYEAFLTRLRAEAELVHTSTGWQNRRLGPDIDVWRLRETVPAG